MLLKVPSNPETLRLCGPILAISVCILAWRLTPPNSLLFTVYMPGKTCHFHRRGARTCRWLGVIKMLIAPVWCSSVGPMWIQLGLSKWGPDPTPRMPWPRLEMDSASVGLRHAQIQPPSATGFGSRGRGGRLRRPPAGVYLTWKSEPFPPLQLEPLEMGTERYISREKAHLFKGLVLDLFMYLTNTFKLLKIFQPNNDSKIHNNRTNSGKPTNPLKKDFSKHSRSCCAAFQNRGSLPAPPRGDHPPELAVNISGLFSEHLLCARQSAGC